MTFVQNSFKYVATLLLLCVASLAFSLQDSTRLNKGSIHNKTLRFTPYFSAEKAKSLGNYVDIVDDSTSFRLSAGISVLNTLRGRIPSINISNHATFANVRETAVLVIDGILYEQSTGNFYNMNAFDYSSLTVLSRGNAAALYGIYGFDGAFILKSKTGENQYKPAIEVNSYLTSARSESNMQKDSESYFSNSIAYMQDFGKIDTRVSYNHLMSPGENNKRHSIKVNTGFDLSPKFNARLIIDNLYDKTFSSSSSTSHAISDSSNYSIALIMDSTNQYIIDTAFHYVYDSLVFNKTTSSMNRDFLQGNLILRYQPFDWLTLTSQSSYGRVSQRDRKKFNTNATFATFDQNRSLVNAFAVIKPNLGSLLSFSPFVGFQYESYDAENIATAGYWNKEYDDKYYLVGANVAFHDWLFADFNYRKDSRNSMPAITEEPTHALSLSFVFTDAFGWSSSFLSFGKIRSSFGETYRQKTSELNLYRKPVGQTEFGTDLVLLKNKVAFTFNYFKERAKKRWDIYNSSAGYWSTTLDGEGEHISGIELIIKATPVKTSSLECQSTLLWTKSKTEGGNYYSSTIDKNTFSNPDWTGSLLHQLTFKNLLVNFLFDVRAGENYVPMGFAYEGTIMKVRDASVGYQLPKIARKIGLRQAQVSLSARNIWLLYSSSGEDPERLLHSPFYQKSTSLSLNFLL